MDWIELAHGRDRWRTLVNAGGGGAGAGHRCQYIMAQLENVHFVGLYCVNTQHSKQHTS